MLRENAIEGGAMHFGDIKKIDIKESGLVNAIAAVESVARKYDVVISTDKVPQEFASPIYKIDGCDPATRQLWFPDKWRGLSAFAFSDIFPEMLHELGHVVCHPPGADIRDVQEGDIQAQFELAVGCELLAKADAERLLPNYYEQSPEWLAGLEKLKRLGVLNNEGRPTWQWPKWENLESN